MFRLRLRLGHSVIVNQRITEPVHGLGKTINLPWALLANGAALVAPPGVHLFTSPQNPVHNNSHQGPYA